MPISPSNTDISRPQYGHRREDLGTGRVLRFEPATRTNEQPATLQVDSLSSNQAALDARATASPETALDTRRAAQTGDPRIQQLQSSLTAPGDTPSATPSEKTVVAAAGPMLRPGYESLDKLAKTLPAKDGRFDPSTPKGRAALAMALAIGGSEVYSKGTTATDFFTRRGGTGNDMLGFGQFNLAYHRSATNSPEKYSRFMADILTGKKPMPNSDPARDHASNLARAIERGQINNGEDLKRWMRGQGFGGSNWQGIDDGWRRVPGLGDDLVRFLKSGQSSARATEPAV